MQRIIVTPLAERDVEEQCAYLGSQRADLAIRFFDAVYETYRTLASSPDLGILGEFEGQRVRDIRWWKVKNFKNHLVLYRKLDDAIEIVRVLQAARDIAALFADD